MRNSRNNLEKFGKMGVGNRCWNFIYFRSVQYIQFRYYCTYIDRYTCAVRISVYVITKTTNVNFKRAPKYHSINPPSPPPLPPPLPKKTKWKNCCSSMFNNLMPKKQKKNENEKKNGKKRKVPVLWYVDC